MIPTSEQKQRANAEGAEKGCLSCPHCGDSAWWKPFHSVAYESGPICADHHKADAGDVRAVFGGEKAIHWLCAECWAILAPEERIAYLDLFAAKQIAGIRMVICIPDGDGVKECPDDKARHERQAVKIRALFNAARNAVEESTA